MEELTTQEVIEFAVSVEQESHAFYTDATDRIDDPSTRRLAEELAAAEVDHLNRLRSLLKLASVTADELGRRVSVDTAGYRKIIKSERIAAGESAERILKRALAREKTTAATYRTLAAMTDLGPDVVELFTYLTRQEEGHVTSIKNRLGRR